MIPQLHSFHLIFHYQTLLLYDQMEIDLSCIDQVLVQLLQFQLFLMFLYQKQALSYQMLSLHHIGLALVDPLHVFHHVFLPSILQQRDYQDSHYRHQVLVLHLLQILLLSFLQ